MKRFAQLYAALDASTSHARKHAALLAYLRDTPAEDAAWGLWFLAGGKPRQLVPTAVLRAALLQRTGMAEWLFDECYAQVGDLAETIALLLPEPTASDDIGLAEWMHERLLPLRGQPPAEQIARLHAQWETLSQPERLLHGKLITGGFRVGVSKQAVVNALAEHRGEDAKTVAQQLVGFTNQLPDAARLQRGGDGGGQPYPFFLAQPLESLDDLGTALGKCSDWLAEWKWDGIRAQWIRRGGRVFLWSRGEELISERFPELQALPLPEGTVIDAELVIGKDGAVQPFQVLQQRIQRKALSPKLLREAPAALIAYDLLELGGEDQRALPQHERRARLEALLLAHPHDALRLSPLVPADDWPQLAALREQARAQGAEGLMLKHRESRYGVGRTSLDGRWLKWKLDPFTVDAVLLYAQKGHGRRANLYSDYSFGVWNEERTQLVPFAKAYSGLSDAEMAQVDARIRATTVESFGPVRSVKPTLVVELGFEGIGKSPRHKSGIAVRFPRMLRLRWDKPVEEADTLETLKALLP